jgi:hypothetical protein
MLHDDLLTSRPATLELGVQSWRARHAVCSVRPRSADSALRPSRIFRAVECVQLTKEQRAMVAAVTDALTSGRAARAVPEADAKEG